MSQTKPLTCHLLSLGGENEATGFSRLCRWCCRADFLDQYRQAATYVDHILKGEKPADMPVQAPTKYQLAINLKTAKAMDFKFPAPVFARADEVIE